MRARTAASCSSLATRAVGEVLPFPDPLVVSGFYLRPGSPGPAEIRTEVIRSGRTTAFGQASLCRDGKEVLRATAAYTDLAAAAARDGRSYASIEAPDLPPPAQCQALHRAAESADHVRGPDRAPRHRASRVGDAHPAVR